MDWSPPANTSAPQYGTWTPPSKGKGKGKDQRNVESDKGFDPQALWCDIHQRYGHSTDWCFDNHQREALPLTPRDPGARHATVPVIQLTHATPLPSAFLARVKVRPKEARVITAIELGKAKTFQLRITLIRPLRPCTMPHHSPQVKTGGLNKS